MAAVVLDSVARVLLGLEDMMTAGAELLRGWEDTKANAWAEMLAGSAASVVIWADLKVPLISVSVSGVCVGTETVLLEARDALLESRMTVVPVLAAWFVVACTPAEVLVRLGEEAEGEEAY